MVTTPSEDPPRPHPRDDESATERLDRELLELLNEVRVAMPGVQVLFGFLLAVPFQQRFETTTHFQRIVYFLTLVSAASATAFLVMPVAYHRVMFRLRDKPQIVKVGSRSLLTGLGLLAVSMVLAVVLVTDVLFKPAVVIPTAVGSALLFGVLWFGYGFTRRVRGSRSW